ncbi:MAG: sulfoxide reductase heme-binding subunit YedZ [Alphaproteobacteria bacterium]|nr:sulfoxide reductase heme-binding subunit YedZ [Alphaproteobacteria bacterium]
MAIFKAPWLERNGKFSPLKASVFAGLFLPAIASAVFVVDGSYAANPVKSVLHDLGLWTIRLMLLSLAVTPAMQIFRYPRLVVVRRMIGVAAFAYGLAHLGLYIAQQGFDLSKVASEIVLRFYLMIGLIALLLLALLSSTSTDGMVRRLGAKNWGRLHRLVYFIAVLALVHYFIQSKLEVFEPTVMAGIFVWLMTYRFAYWSGGVARAASPVTLALLAVLSYAVSALGEAAGYALFTPVDGRRVLLANLSFVDIRPGWYVLAMGAAVFAATLIRRAMMSERR